MKILTPWTQNTLMNYTRQSLFHFCLRHWKQYFLVRCETPTDGWTDGFQFFFCVSMFHPFQTKSPCHIEGWETHTSVLTPQLPQYDTWQMDTHMSEPQYAHCLSHSLYIHTMAHTHATHILSVHRNLLACQLWKARESSGKITMPWISFWQLIWSENNRDSKPFQWRVGCIISFLIMWMTCNLRIKCCARCHGFCLRYKQYEKTWVSHPGNCTFKLRPEMWSSLVMW